MNRDLAPSHPPLAWPVETFAALAGIGRTSVFAEIKAGRLRVARVGRRTLIRVEDGRAWLEAAAAATDQRTPA